VSDLVENLVLCVVGAFLIAATTLLEKPPAAVPVVGLVAITFGVAGVLGRVRRAWSRPS